MHELELPYAATGLLLLDEDAEQTVLLGLHGYGGTAAAMMESLRPLAASCGMGLACPEAPHDFYRAGQVGASWMTRHRRAAAIGQCQAWLQAVLANLRARGARRIVVLGFSQGASQAWRLAWEVTGLAAVIIVGGDIPPELRHGPIPEHPAPALVVRGARDRIYDADSAAADLLALQHLGWPHQHLLVDTDHALDATVIGPVGAWLRARWDDASTALLGR